MNTDEMLSRLRRWASALEDFPPGIAQKLRVGLAVNFLRSGCLLVNSPRQEYSQQNQIKTMGWKFHQGQGTLISKNNRLRAMIAVTLTSMVAAK